MAYKGGRFIVLGVQVVGRWSHVMECHACHASPLWKISASRIMSHLGALADLRADCRQLPQITPVFLIASAFISTILNSLISISHNLSFLWSRLVFITIQSTPQQKNTCAHNNTQKAHANGIKKKKRTKYVSTRGMDPKFLRNQKFCKKWNSSKRPHDD
jgi:large subunit ribosomal protein L29e